MANLSKIETSSIIYVDEAGFDNRDDYAYGYSSKGERCYALKSGKRTQRISWIAALKEGTHDCRNYIVNYIELHRKHKLEVRVCSAFWYDTPSDRQSRLKLERELILRWKSPFNQENWSKYGKPFGKI